MSKRFKNNVEASDALGDGGVRRGGKDADANALLSALLDPAGPTPDPDVEDLLALALADDASTKETTAELPAVVTDETDDDSLVAELVQQAKTKATAPSSTHVRRLKLPEVLPLGAAAGKNADRATGGSEHGASAEAASETVVVMDARSTAELPVAAESLSFEGIEQGLLMIEAKKKRIWPVFVTGIVIFILLTAALTYVSRVITVEQEAKNAQIDRAAEAYLDEAIAYIQNADTVIVALDTSFFITIGDQDIPKLEALLDEKQSVIDSLDNAIAKAQQAKDGYASESKKELAQHAIDAANLRKDMLEIVSQVTHYDILAMKDALAIDYVMRMINEANAETQSAVETVQVRGAEGYGDSLALNKSALDKLLLAEQALGVIDSSELNVDIRPITDYLAVRKMTAELGIAADQAFIDQDQATHNQKIDEYNAMLDQLSAAQANIPAVPRDLVYTTYTTATTGLKEEYLDTRSLAADNDVYLRDYLSATIEQIPQ